MNYSMKIENGKLTFEADLEKAFQLPKPCRADVEIMPEIQPGVDCDEPAGIIKISLYRSELDDLSELV